MGSYNHAQMGRACIQDPSLYQEVGIKFDDIFLVNLPCKCSTHVNFGIMRKYIKNICKYIIQYTYAIK